MTYIDVQLRNELRNWMICKLREAKRAYLPRMNRFEDRQKHLRFLEQTRRYLKHYQLLKNEQWILKPLEKEH